MAGSIVFSPADETDGRKKKTMDYKTQLNVTEEMVAEIKMRIANPAEWLYAVRRIAERMDLCVERVLPLAGVTLMTACEAVIAEAVAHDYTAPRMRAAIAEWCSYHPAPVDTMDRRNIA